MVGAWQLHSASGRRCLQGQLGMRAEVYILKSMVTGPAPRLQITWYEGDVLRLLISVENALTLNLA
jgi:hypothetical protein